MATNRLEVAKADVEAEGDEGLEEPALLDILSTEVVENDEVHTLCGLKRFGPALRIE